MQGPDPSDFSVETGREGHVMLTPHASTLNQYQFIYRGVFISGFSGDSWLLEANMGSTLVRFPRIGGLEPGRLEGKGLFPISTTRGSNPRQPWVA